jgi:hypothetical protein
MPDDQPPEPAESGSLVDQAERLILRLKVEPQADSLQALGCDLAVACHGRMLDLDTRDRAGAIQHAFAGASLILVLRQQGSRLPDWLDVHEEQLCRNGGLWIHQSLFNGSTDSRHSPDLASVGPQGVSLLARLQEIHGTEHGWIGDYLSALQNLLAQSARESGAAKNTFPKIALAGNCQAWPLLLYLRQLFPDAQLHHCPSVHLATPEEVSEFNHLLPSVDVLVMHRIQPGYRYNIGLDNQTLSSHLSPGARQLVLPSLHYEGHHPWIGYAHDPDGRLAQLEESSPLGPYHDFLAMAAARRGLSAQDLLRRPPPEELVRRIREQHRNSLEQLRQREIDCAVEISSWIDHHHRDVPIVHTINHPTHAALTELLGRVLQKLKLSPTVEGKILETQEFLGELTIPVVPWVREALHLGNWAEAWGQKEGKVWSIGEQLAASISYYQRHPWIGEANRDNGKQRFADHCLDLLEAEPSSTRLAEEGPT